MSEFEEGTIAKQILDEVMLSPNGTREVTLVQYINHLIQQKGGDPISAPEVEPTLEDLTVKELKELCEEKGLPIYGTKALLIERLNE
jgi:hypothetical protein